MAGWGEVCESGEGGMGDLSVEAAASPDVVGGAGGSGWGEVAEGVDSELPGTSDETVAQAAVDAWEDVSEVYAGPSEGIDWGAQRPELDISNFAGAGRRRRGRPNLRFELAMQRLREEEAARGPPAGVEPARGDEEVVAPASAPRASLASVVGATKVPKSLATFTPVPTTAGIGRVVPFASPLMAAARLAATSADSDLGCGVRDMIAERFSKPDANPIIKTKVATALDHGMDRKTADAALRRAALVALWKERAARAAIEAEVVRVVPSRDLLAYCDQVRHDETPMRVAVRDDGCVVQAPRQQVSSAGAEAIVEVAQSQSTVVLPVATNTSPAKLLQTEQGWGLLFKLRGTYVVLMGDTICDLSLLESATARALAEAQARLSCVTRAATRFRIATRAAALDRAPANDLCERIIQQQRGQPWQRVVLDCTVHLAATGHKLTFLKTELANDISGMLNVALSVRVGAQFQVFKRCLRSEVQSRLCFLRGRPPPEATRYRDAMLELFLRGDNTQENAARRAILQAVPIGDWRTQDRIEIYIPGDVEVDPDSYAESISAALEMGLCRAPFSLYPRHRWTGADKSVSDLGLVESFGGLLTAAYRRFVDEQPSSRLKEKRAEDLPAASPSGLAPAQRAASQAFGHDAEDASHAHSAQDLVAVQQSDAPWATTGDDGMSLAEHNAARKVVSLQYLLSSPLDRMVLVRIAIEPFRA